MVETRRMTLHDLLHWHHTNGSGLRRAASCGACAGGGVMRLIGDGTGGDLAHIWLFPAEEQVDEQPTDMVATARASDARQSK